MQREDGFPSGMFRSNICISSHVYIVFKPYSFEAPLMTCFFV